MPFVKLVDLAFGTSGELVHLIVTLVLHVLIKRGGLSIVGLENLPSNAPYLVVSSHCLPMAAEYDIFKFIVKHRVKPWTVARQPVTNAAFFLQDSLVYLWHRYHPGTILVDGTKSSSDLTDNALRELKAGVVNWLSPEGIRNYGVGLFRGQVGIARLLTTDCSFTIVPMTVINDEGIHSVCDLFASHPDLKLIIGKPFKLTKPPKSASRQDLVEITDEVMCRIARLMPEHKRGYYSYAADAEFKYTEEVEVSATSPPPS